jgi:CrcB protein
VKSVGLVVLGGFFGTLARHLMGTGHQAPDAFAYTTLAINLAGSALLGALAAALVGVGPRAARELRLAVGTGVLGGFTTYSAFALETEQLLRAGHAGVAGLCALASVAGGVAAALAGFALASRAVR